MRRTISQLRELAKASDVPLQSRLRKSEIVAKLVDALPQILTLAGGEHCPWRTCYLVVDFLAALCANRDPDTRQAGLLALIQLTQKPTYIREMAQYRLPRINHPEVIATHRRMFVNQAVHYRFQTLQVLIELQGAQCQDVLIAALDDGYTRTHELVLTHLARWAPLAAEDLAHRHILSGTHNLRLEAAHVIGAIHHLRSLAPLFAAALDCNRHVRAAALRALRNMEGSPAKRCIDALHSPKETIPLVRFLVDQTPHDQRERLKTYLVAACQRSPSRHRRPIYRALHETLLASRQTLVKLLLRRLTTPGARAKKGAGKCPHPSLYQHDY